MSQIAVEEKDAGSSSSSPSALSSHPLLRLGFRPHYLLGAAFAAIGIPAWLLRYHGYADGLARIDLNWHAHEMVYGFAAAILNLGFHAARPGWIAVSPLHMVQAAIMVIVIVIIESAIGGRVIPNFTASAVRDSRPVVNDRRDRITLGLTAGAGIAWALALPGAFVAGVAAAAAVAQMTRLLAAVGPAWMRDAGLVLSALCWSLAFLAYVVVYGPYLVNARIDGREG